MSDRDSQTRDLDQFALVRALIERSARENAEANAALKEEFRTFTGTVDGLRHEVHRLAGRVTAVEGDIRELRDRDATITRHVSSSDLEHEAAMGGAIAHVAKVEEDVRLVKTESEKNARVNEAVCRELGLDHQAIVEGSVSIPPPGGKLPKTTLARLATENKVGTYAATTTAGLALAVIVAKIIAHLLGVTL